MILRNSRFTEGMMLFFNPTQASPASERDGQPTLVEHPQSESSAFVQAERLAHVDI